MIQTSFIVFIIYLICPNAICKINISAYQETEWWIHCMASLLSIKDSSKKCPITRC